MAKTVFDDTPPVGTIVTDAFLNAVNTHRHTGRDLDGDGALDYALATGSSNAYAITLSPALDAHITGMPVVFKANHTNTGAATININSLGAIAIKRSDGSALQAGDIVSGQMVLLMYDGTDYQAQTVQPPVIPIFSSVPIAPVSVASGTHSSWTAIDLTSYVPSTAIAVFGYITISGNSSDGFVASASDGKGAQGVWDTGSAGYGGCAFRIPITNYPYIYYKGDNVHIYVSGYDKIE